jgi:hypothetical protein
MVAVKLWSAKLVNLRLQIMCDNLASVTVINSGKTKDATMLSLLREIAFISAKANCQIKAVHVLGKNNRVSDLLSRAPMDSRSKSQLSSVIDKSWKQILIPDHMFCLSNNW